MENTETVTGEIVHYDGPQSDQQESRLPARPSIFEMEPEEQVAKATQIANALVKVVEKQRLFTTISGRKHVKVDGWLLLGTFLGVLPRETSVIENEDGSFEARVDLVRSSTGVVVGGASAICGKDEIRWAKADKYARRSMATTRAIGKAYRSSFSWIINLAGYEVTPEEEMPNSEHQSGNTTGTGQAPQENKRESGSVRSSTNKPAAGATQKSEEVRLYTGDTDQQKNVQAILKKNEIPEVEWLTFHEKMMGKPGYELPKLIKEYKKHVETVRTEQDSDAHQAGQI